MSSAIAPEVCTPGCGPDLTGIQVHAGHKTERRSPRSILEEALRITDGGRDLQYGKPERCFEEIAALWSYYLDHPVSPQQVAIMMVLLKVVRQKAKHKDDNLVDMAGYAALAAELEP